MHSYCRPCIGWDSNPWWPWCCLSSRSAVWATGTLTAIPTPSVLLTVINTHLLYWIIRSLCVCVCVCVCVLQIRAGEAAAIISRELSEQTKGHMHAGDITYTVRAMGHLIDLLDVQLRNLTPGGKDSAARSLNKVLRLTYNTIIYVKSNV